ncbi:MAG: ABC transporter permease [Synergistaceae bacterium]|jgi:oligopeptide transport system permease protein|nr:ABC transporter permease [Synergistaceae bacterium]
MSDLAKNSDMPDIEDPWGKLSLPAEAMEMISGSRRTFASDVWFRFRRKVTSLLGMCLILVVTAFALIGPSFTDFSYEEQNLEYVSIPPLFRAVEYGGRFFYITANLKLIEVGGSGRLLGSVARVSADDAAKRSVFDGGGLTLTLDYSARPYTLLDDGGRRVESRRSIWNRTYLLGSDSLGRDIMTRLMYGARISLLVAFTAATANLLIGVFWGSVSAYCGGMTDAVMMRIVDIINTLPLTLYVILIMVFLDAGLASIVMALGTVYWVNMARVVRGEILSLKERDFVLASRTIGSPPSVILCRHLIPNAMGPILVTLTMLIPQAIFMEAFLSFIGLGIPAPLASLGTMCSDAIGMLRTSPYQLFEPAIAICALTFGFNFIGDGLRDALDPKLRK